jgi:hypothetical protein
MRAPKPGEPKRLENPEKAGKKRGGGVVKRRKMLKDSKKLRNFVCTA